MPVAVADLGAAGLEAALRRRRRRLYLVGGDQRADDARPIVRLTVRVIDLDTAPGELVLDAPDVVVNARGRSVLLPAAGTSGVALELLERGRRRP